MVPASPQVRNTAFDTGALIRLQRDRAALRDVLKAWSAEQVSLSASAVAITEFLGGSPRQQRGAADWIAFRFEISGITEPLARRGATLMRLSRDASASPAGPIDALVVAEAEARGATVVISGDRADFAALAAASGHVEMVDIEELIG
jgi:predicted nucleic acid-binding protein